MAFFSKLTSLVSDVKGSIAAVVSENKSQFQAEELKIEDDKRKLAAKQALKVYPLWTVMNEDQTILEGELKTRILKLSMDVNTFKEDPPVPTAFRFDFNRSAPFAEQALKDDSNLNVARYRLVRPKGVKEDQFWRNYFYRVWMIREDIGVHPLPLGPAENDLEEIAPEVLTPAAVVVMAKRPTPSTGAKKSSLPVATAVGAKTAASAKKSTKPDDTSAAINDSISEAERLNNEMSDLLGEDFVNVGHSDAVDTTAAKKPAAATPSVAPVATSTPVAAPTPAAATTTVETTPVATTPAPAPVATSTPSAVATPVASSSSPSPAKTIATATPVTALTNTTPTQAPVPIVAPVVTPAKSTPAPPVAVTKPKVVPLSASSSSDLPELDDIDSLLAEASESDPTDDITSSTTGGNSDNSKITDDDLTRDLDGDLP